MLFHSIRRGASRATGQITGPGARDFGPGTLGFGPLDPLGYGAPAVITGFNGATADGLSTNVTLTLAGLSTAVSGAQQDRNTGAQQRWQAYLAALSATTAAYWEQEIYVGKVNTYTLKDVSIDDVKFGVKAIGVNGSESLVTSYAYPPRQKVEIETVQ